MANPFTDTPKIGVDLNRVDTAIDIAAGNISGTSHRLGSEVWGTDGKKYVYAEANATISASTSVATVSPTTFLVTASGGAYSNPAAMVKGDRAWFATSSV